MEHRTFYYDSTVCLGCGACQVACQSSHGLLPEEFFRRVVTWRDTEGRLRPFSGACNHCANPACVAACPTGAMYRDEGAGVVLHNDGLCIGCGCCIWNCPYGAVSISKTRGVSQKCDSCQDRRKEGLPPACVTACPMGALGWDRPGAAEAGPGWQQLAAPFLPAAEQTEPSTMVRWTEGEGI